MNIKVLFQLADVLNATYRVAYASILIYELSRRYKRRQPNPW